MQEAEAPDYHDSRGTAAMYLARLARWQEANGGFRRIPTKAVDEKLNNWIHRSRFKFRHGTLNPDVAEQLKTMGALSEDADGPDGLRHEVYERARWSVAYLRQHGFDQHPERMAQHRDIDPALEEWITEVRALAGKLPGCSLLADLRSMVPEFFKQKIEDAMSLPTVTPRRRARRSPIEQIGGFLSSQERLPDILSTDERERQLASWLIAIEHGLLDVDMATDENTSEAAASRRVEAALADSRKRQRDAQWRWWSSVAMELLRVDGESGRWEERLYQETPDQHATRLELNLVAAREGKPGWAGGPWGVDHACLAMAIDRSKGLPVNPMRVLKDVGTGRGWSPGLIGLAR